MNYYEELGLCREASVQEIRQAYKVLARLVHPDGQGDAVVREMAERQMKRLNEILATLTDTRKRREYDSSLYAPMVAFAPASATPDAPPPAARVAAVHRQAVRVRPQPEPWRTHLPAWADSLLLNWFWIVLMMVVLSVGWWYVAAGKATPAAVIASHVRNPAVKEAHPTRRPAPVVTRHKGLQPTQRAPHPLASHSRPAPKSVGSIEATQMPLREAPSARPTVDAVPAQAAAPPPAVAPAEPDRGPARSEPAAPSFAGNWFYVRDNGAAPAPGAYLATYVEFLLTEAHGELSGDYRAYFRIPDLAMSPEVSFRARGQSPTGDSARLNWTAANGARGQVELTLRGPNQMIVTWWTTELGRQEALASGTARLVRQQAP
ncbi:MAG: J domain-containing protein [Bryobacteraceae bacterium]|jgi:hypothetical protein